MAALDPVMVEEWIGRRVRVLDAANPSQVGLEGVLVDEGARTVLLRRDDGREARVQKKGARLQTTDGRVAIIEAGEALMRPEDRTKRLYRQITQK